MSIIQKYHIECLLFDLDGTLVDTAPDLINSLNILLIECGKQPVQLKTARWWVSGGTIHMIEKAFKMTNFDALHSLERKKLLHYYEKNLCKYSNLFPGIPKLLRFLDDLKIPWGIVTNKPERFTLPLIYELGLDSRAKIIVSGDTCKRNKPDPMPLRYATNKLSVNPTKTVFIGDDKRDITAGKSCSMITGAVSWGYSIPTEDIWGADWLVNKPEEIINHIYTT